MNPVVYNTKGQFRFNDFVGYLPEFLKTEPDVVTLMQVFSDYINNAYRNIVTTEEFEFMLVCSATNVLQTTRRLEKLQNMFKLAEERSDAVILMSVPRNNIKSNAILGNSGAEYAVEIEVDDNTVQDSIPHAVSRGIDPNAIDGSVVYVVYRAQDPIKKIPYYYDRNSDTLFKDPMGSSQDPFTATSNKTNRMVQFTADNVSKVSKRFGKVVDNVTYYEVFFTLHISNVCDVNSLATVDYDVDGVDEVPDHILVDYYNTASVGEDNYHTYVKFYGTDGFTWKAGFPTGIFYFRETSGANLVSLTDTKTILSRDITLSNEVERYRINKIEIAGAGLIRVYTEGYPQAFDNAIFYMLDGRTSERKGVFRMESGIDTSSRLDGGKKYVTLVAMDGFDVNALLEMDNLVLATIPLFYNAGVLDYENKYKVIRWNDQYPDESGFVLSTDTEVNMRGASVETNQLVIENYIPKRLSLYAFKSDRDFTPGDRLYCANTLWNGIAVVKKSFKLSDSEWRVELFSKTNQYSDPINIYNCDAGFIKVDSDRVGTGFWRGTYEKDSYVLLRKVGEETMRLYKIADVSNGGGTISFYKNALLEECDYEMFRVTIDAGVLVKHLKYVKLTDENVYTAAIKYSVGDVFVQKYMFAADKNSGSAVLLKMVSDVDPVEYKVYEKGSYVSNGKNVYVATKRVTLADGDDPSSVYGFMIDNYAHYSVGFKSMENAFMPFYGQYTTLDYGERPNYNGDMSVTLLPLYICKQNDTRLRYGWKQREYLYYGDQIGLDNTARSGFVELYSNNKVEHDIVNVDLEKTSDAYLDYIVMTSGCDSIYAVDIDSNVTAKNNFDGTWTVIMKSSAHGLPAGAEISIEGIKAASQEIMDLFNQTNVKVDVPNPDTLSFTVACDDSLNGSFYYGDVSEAKAYYIRDYQYCIKSIKLANNSTESTDNTVLRLNVINGADHVIPGDVIEIRGVPNLDGAEANNINGVYTVLEDPDTSTDDDKYIYVVMDTHISTDENEYVLANNNARVIDKINNGDIVTQYVDGKYFFYRVTNNNWEKLSRTDIITPTTVYSQQNLFDLDSKTNMAYALSDDYVIRRLTNNHNGTALVNLQKGIPYFSTENAEFIEGKCRVYITNVFPAVYDGWHTVTKVHSSGIFEIKLKESPKADSDWQDAVPIVNRKMTLNVGEWFRYTLHSYDWDKVSNTATYATSNTITTVSTRNATNIIHTKYVHNFKVGDKVVVDLTGRAAYDVDYDKVDGVVSLDVFQSEIAKIIDEYTFTLIDNDIPFRLNESTIYRGLVIGVENGQCTTKDNLEILIGEYTKFIPTLGKDYRFTNGDIIFTLGQVCNDEVMAWRVVADKAWIPLRKKRTIKVDSMTIEQYMNPGYSDTDPNGSTARYKYRRVSCVDVYNEAKNSKIYFIVEPGLARNYHFEHLHVDELDTTQSIDMQYSSKFDYATVAPRNDMDESFIGVPDMKYPLIEKIERLAYLKDINVIDYELIGYLARYMGYDITSVADDINESNVYRNSTERELALRETIAHLPQYYALGGTMPGVNMLMATFGIVADLVTMWTNTDNPYGELLRKREADQRIRADVESGKNTGTWVPTPHVNLDIPLNSNFKNILIDDSEINMMKEQIRRFKPINVVFDDVCVIVKANLESKAYMTTAGGTATSAPIVSSVSMAEDASTESDLEVIYDACTLNNCMF